MPYTFLRQLLRCEGITMPHPIHQTRDCINCDRPSSNGGDICDVCAAEELAGAQTKGEYLIIMDEAWLLLGQPSFQSAAALAHWTPEESSAFVESIAKRIDE